MNKQEFIEKIKGHGAWCTEYRDIHGEKDIYVKVAKVRELLEQLDEPQAEKVEVSQEFADWVEKAMAYQVMTKEWCLKEIANMGWRDWLHDPQNSEKYPCDNHWSCEVSRNKEKHIKAIYDGYTVKPRRWVVKYTSVFNQQYYFIGWDTRYSLLPNGYKIKTGDNVMTFTDKSKAEAVATLVEGSVEEV